MKHLAPWSCSLLLIFVAACHLQSSEKSQQKSSEKTLQQLLQKNPDQSAERILQTQKAQKALRKQEEKSWQGQQGKMRSTSVGNQQIIRIGSEPIDGVPVEGVEQILTIERQTRQVQSLETPAQIEKQGDFKLDARQAMLQAYKNLRMRQPSDAKLKKLIKAATKVWLNHNNILRPAWKITLLVTPLEQSKQVWVDAETGSILKQTPLVHLSTETDVFPHAPGEGGVNMHDLERAALEDLAVPLTPGSPLLGKYIHTRNCCWYVKCPSEKPDCQTQERICARAGEPGAEKHRILLRVDTQSDPGLMQQLGRTQPFFVSAWRCMHGNLARYQDEKGFQATPTADGTMTMTLNSKALDDPFAEIQAYHVASSFFRYLRRLFGDDAWCLRSSSMSCQTDGSPKMDSTGLPENPFRIHVNYASPRLELNNVANQLQQGQGSEQNPVLVDSISLTENAAFVPGLPSVLLQSLSTQEKLENLWRPYDHIVLYQGYERDYAYDGDVVAHEIGHALVATLVPSLGRQGWDSWGPQVEPGSLNEGWADYFAAAFAAHRNIPGSHAVGEYVAGSEAGLRSLATVRRCPDDVVGEVHHDSLIWSSALWAVRSWILEHLTLDDVSAWDRLVLSALAQATSSESFARQSAKLLALARGHPTLGSPEALKKIKEVFTDRGVSACNRVFPLARVAGQTNVVNYQTKSELYHPSPQEAGLSGDAPPIMQMRIDVPAGGDSFTLQWRQRPLDFSSSVQPMEVFITEESPLKWAVNGSSIEAKADTFSGRKWASLINNSSSPLWKVSHSFLHDPCRSRAFYVSLLNTAGSWRLENIEARVSAPQHGSGSNSTVCQESRTEEDLKKEFHSDHFDDDTLVRADETGESPENFSVQGESFEETARGSPSSQASSGSVNRGVSDTPSLPSGGCGGSNSGFDATIPLLLMGVFLSRKGGRRRWARTRPL